MVVSDDLLMGAIGDHYGVEEAAILALSAGVDMLLISDTSPGEDPGAADRVLHALRGALSEGKLSPFLLERALIRLHRFRARVEGS